MKPGNFLNRYSGLIKNAMVLYVITQGSYELYRSTSGGVAFTKIKDIRNEVLNVIK